MKKLNGIGRVLILFIFMLVYAITLFAADILVTWNASAGATGYKLEYSIDNGGTWSTPLDIGMVQPIDYVSGTTHFLLCSYNWIGLPDTGLVLVRVTAYNAVGPITRTDAGAWFNKSWAPPIAPKGVGIVIQ